jgi:hypothetical protein
MDVALDPRDERRARRLGIAVRLVLYPIALGLIVLAWKHYHPDRPHLHVFHVVTWAGVTSQGQAMRARTADGVLTGFDTRVLQRCPRGSGFTGRWYPGQHRFVQRGEELRGRQAGSGRSTSGQAWTFDNRVWARIGDHPRGTIRTRSTLGTGQGTVRCDSGPVSFALRSSP